MPYKFTFDLSKAPRLFFAEVAEVVYERSLHRRASGTLQNLIGKFGIQEATDLNMPDAVRLLEDFADVEVKNLLGREKFRGAERRALFLPHCSRKYMDGMCKATFDPGVPCARKKPQP